jgi:hypothetical protein
MYQGAACKCGHPMCRRQSFSGKWIWDCLHCGEKQMSGRENKVRLSPGQTVEVPYRQPNKPIRIIIQFIDKKLNKEVSKMVGMLTDRGLEIKDNNRRLKLNFGNKPVVVNLTSDGRELTTSMML